MARGINSGETILATQPNYLTSMPLNYEIDCVTSEPEPLIPPNPYNLPPNTLKSLIIYLEPIPHLFPDPY